MPQTFLKFMQKNAKFWKTFIVLSAWLYPALSSAETFNTSYVSFEIPHNWTCISEGVNWLCFNKNKKVSREAVIILTAKEIGAQDNLPEYLRYLKQKKSYKSKKGKSITSKVFHSKQRTIDQHAWVDGLHLESEIPNYYTRYLVSSKKNLAVLVTYSTHQKLWKKYSNDFNKSIQSLRLLSVDEALKKLRDRQNKGGGRSIRDYLEGIIGDSEADFEDGKSKKGILGALGDHLGVAAGGAAGAFGSGLLLWKFLGRKSRKPRSIASSARRRRRK